MRQKKGMFLMPRRFSLKTRLLSLLLSAAMVLMFLPASAFAAADKQVLVGDTWLGSANRSVTCGDGTAEYDPDTQTLTLTKATINSGHAAAICNMTYGLTIKLVGENSINSDNQPGILSVQSCGLLTLTGEGSLNITAANGHAIYVNTGSLLVKDTTVKVSSNVLAVYADLDIEISNSTFESASTDGNAIWTPRDLTIENSNVTTNSAGNFPAIWCDGDITINGGQLKSTCIGSDALGAAGTLSITNCNVENKGGYTALYSGGEMTLTGGSITAEAERNAIMSKSAMTITNATVKATAQKYNALRASDVMKIDKGRVEATTFGEETYAIHMEPMDDGNNGRMEIGGGVELYVNGYNGISVGEGATIEDARIVIDSEACSIDMPVKFADGYDIARALGGDSKENAKPFDWYSMSLEPYTPNQPGTFPYLELLSGAKHTLRVTNGTISEMNGKQYTGNEAEIPAGSPVTLTLTVNEDAFTAGDVFSSWTLSPTPRDLRIDGNVITFTMPAEDVEISATSDIPPEPTPDAEGSPLLGLALVAVGGTLVGLTLYAAHEFGITQTLRETLPAGAAIPANRGELALLLWNAADKPEPEKQPAFTDVSDLETAKAAQWAIEAGLMETESSGKFAPAKRVTRLKVFKTWKAAGH
jgi:hypothetical protein